MMNKSCIIVSGLEKGDSNYDKICGILSHCNDILGNYYGKICPSRLSTLPNGNLHGPSYATMISLSASENVTVNFHNGNPTRAEILNNINHTEIIFTDGIIREMYDFASNAHYLFKFGEDGDMHTRMTSYEDGSFEEEHFSEDFLLRMKFNSEGSMIQRRTWKDERKKSWVTF